MEINEEKIDQGVGFGKAILSFATGAGVARIVDGVVNTHAPQTGKYGKVVVFVAKFGIIAAISAAVDRENNKTIDHMVTGVKNALSESSD
jgi:hypothetical protein